MGEFSRSVNKSMLCAGKVTIATDEAKALGVMEELLKRERKTKVSFIFEENKYEGQIAWRDRKSSPYIELSYPTKLTKALSRKFIHTYLREIGAIKKQKEEGLNAEAIKFKKIEKGIIEITALTRISSEYDGVLKKIIEWDLFNLKKKDEIKRSEDIILKSYEWIDRAELNTHKNANNVVYYLCDENNKQIYIGSGKLLGKRLGHERNEIPSWSKFRYDIIKPEYAHLLQRIEMFVIRSYSNIMQNLGGYTYLAISDYQMNNKDCGRK